MINWKAVKEAICEMLDDYRSDIFDVTITGLIFLWFFCFVFGIFSGIEWLLFLSIAVPFGCFIAYWTWRILSCFKEYYHDWDNKIQ